MPSRHVNKMMLAITAVGGIIGGAVATIMYQHDRSTVPVELQQRVLATVQGAAATLNGDLLLEQITASTGESMATNCEAEARLDALLSALNRCEPRATGVFFLFGLPEPEAPLNRVFVASADLEGEAAFRAPVVRNKGKITSSVVGRAELADNETLLVAPGTSPWVDCYQAVAVVRDSQRRKIGWLGAQVHASRMLAAISPTYYTALAVAGLALLVSAGAGFLVSRWLTRPMRHITDGVQRIVEGDLSHRLNEEQADEFGLLARAANNAAGLMQSLDLAQQVQRSLLPQGSPVIPGLDIAAFCQYCEHTGGDYFDFLPIGEEGKDGCAIVVGDVTGHGVPAALLMATARAVLRLQNLRSDNLPESVARMNRELCGLAPEGRFMTMFLLAVEPGRQRVRWLSAGHDAAIVFDPMSGKFSELGGDDLPLGVAADWQFAETVREAPLAPGQVIVIGTDGIWELRSGADKMFGKENMRRVVRKHFNRTAREIGQELLNALAVHRGGVPQQDDVTFVVVKVETPRTG